MYEKGSTKKEKCGQEIAWEISKTFFVLVQKDVRRTGIDSEQRRATIAPCALAALNRSKNLFNQETF